MIDIKQELKETVRSLNEFMDLEFPGEICFLVKLKSAAAIRGCDKALFAVETDANTNSLYSFVVKRQWLTNTEDWNNRVMGPWFYSAITGYHLDCASMLASMQDYIFEDK